MDAVDAESAQPLAHGEMMREQREVKKAAGSGGNGEVVRYVVTLLT